MQSINFSNTDLSLCSYPCGSDTGMTKSALLLYRLPASLQCTSSSITSTLKQKKKQNGVTISFSSFGPGVILVLLFLNTVIIFIFLSLATLQKCKYRRCCSNLTPSQHSASRPFNFPQIPTTLDQRGIMSDLAN